jgi:hypothetical protein
MSKKFIEAEWESLQDAHARTSLSISELYRNCITEEILSVHLVKPGKKKGVRLINRKSLDDYIRSFMPGGSRHQKPQLAAAK